MGPPTSSDRATRESARSSPSPSTSPLFLLFFASTYFILSLDDARSFTEPLDRSDALYFTVTVFTTLGFGDISAQEGAASLVVTAQMLLDVVVVGIGIQVIIGAAKRGRAGASDTEELSGN